MTKSVKHEARAVLSAVGIAVNQDFNSLSQEQHAAVSSEAAEAYQRKHGNPMPADSATYIRKRYDLLQMRARR